MVFEQPVALSVQRRNVRKGALQLLTGRGLRLRVRLQRSFHVRLGHALLGQKLRVGSALLGGAGHHARVVGLRVLLRRLSLGHLLVKVLDEEVDHRDHARVLPRLLGVRAEGLGRRRRRVLVLLPHVLGDLREHRDAGAGDAAGSRGRRQGAAVVYGDAVLLRQLLLRGGLVQLRVVEFVEAVLGEHDELLGGAVAGHELRVLRMLLLPLLGRLRHGLVERDDARLQGRDLLRERLDALLGLGDHRLKVRD
mmetsp:Transcript_64521/g.166047  ORF Transcript_64521/g.166047 Transcript_64521/m.166047 type:complete len:251 (-) Transcript_64521:311-1063(-)